MSLPHGHSQAANHLPATQYCMGIGYDNHRVVVAAENIVLPI